MHMPVQCTCPGGPGRPGADSGPEWLAGRAAMDILLLVLALAAHASGGASTSGPAAAAGPSGLSPSRQFAVTVDGEAAFVYLATTDGSNVHNGSFVHIRLHPGGPREVVVTLLEPDAEGPPKLGALRPDPVGKAGSLPQVKLAGTTATFQAATPMHAVLEFGSEGYELTSFSSGLMIFAEFVDTDAPDLSVRARTGLAHAPPPPLPPKPAS
eukprot:SAG22_NODE_2727_length_2276_cov_1.092329_2_plen_211_part_00